MKAPRHDVGEFRREFPTLEHGVHLASCSLGARSTRLDAAMSAMLDAACRPGAWQSFEEQIDQLRQRCAALIGARPDQVALMPNASTGAYQVASTFRWQQPPWQHRPRLVTTVAEFPSIAHVWLAQRPRGAEVVFVGDATSAVSAEDYLAVIDDRTALVSVPATTYRDGTRLRVATIAAAAHAVGAKVIVDAYQAVGVEPVNVDQLGCDYLIAGFSKYLLGLPGAALLYARNPEDEAQQPQLTGWFGRVDPSAFDPRRLDFPPAAQRFETGTPAVPTVYAANAGLSLIDQLDLHAVRRHVEDLIAYAAAQLRGQGEAVRLAASPSAQGAHLPLLDSDPQALAAWLAEWGIAVSPRADVARLSVHAYTSRDDIDALCTALHAYRRQAGGWSPSTQTRGLATSGGRR
ncbi:aminotransferase class V-fold PLP-dependent enzyme [Micromonospora arborensis]|uniref:aminotransferase class V-fold PLP-dependent enzyme n=1 Tax=Micromonospora arborensis TaxID=2116518 RepID=UPI0033E3D387